MAARPLIEAVREEAYRTAEAFYLLVWEAEDMPAELVEGAWATLERFPDRVPALLRRAEQTSP